jgi:hypothetical protein
MTRTDCLGRLLRVACLGLIGVLAAPACDDDHNEGNDGAITYGDAAIDQKPLINASLASVTVGHVDVGMTSSPATVTITNIGTAPATLTVTPLPAGIIAATGCDTVLAVGESCVLSVTATPRDAACIAGKVTVAAAGGNTVTIAVTEACLGGPARFIVTPGAVSLGDVAVGVTVPATVMVTAQSALTDLTFGVQGANLKLDPATDCQATLAVNATCNIVVTFTSATPGAATSDAIYVSSGGVKEYVPVSANVLALAR